MAVHSKSKREANRLYYQKNKERLKLASKAYYYKSHAKIREKVRVDSAIKYRALRNELFDKLGRQCVRCGFSDIRALHFDHKNGGGRRERLSFKGSYIYYYKHLLKNIDSIQVLCANCNTIKMYEKKEHPKKEVS